jgi:uncharacterized protein
MSSEPEFLYRIQPTRPAMLQDDPTPAEREAIGAHRRYLDTLAAAGVVLLFGRTDTADAATFGIVIFRAASLNAARRIVEEDPAVQAGVMRAEVFPFRVIGVGPGLSIEPHPGSIGAPPG